jgi:hypothetical protein
LQRLQSKLFRTTGNFLFRNLHIAFELPYLYDYVSKYCRQQAEVIQTCENANIRNIGQGEPQHKKYKRLKLGGGQAYDRSRDLTAVVAGATNHMAWSVALILG